MGTNFPGSLNLVDFTGFFHATGNLWGNTFISNIIKYIIGCNS